MFRLHCVRSDLYLNWRTTYGSRRTWPLNKFSPSISSGRLRLQICGSWEKDKNKKIELLFIYFIFTLASPRGWNWKCTVVHGNAAFLDSLLSDMYWLIEVQGKVKRKPDLYSFSWIVFLRLWHGCYKSLPDSCRFYLERLKKTGGRVIQGIRVQSQADRMQKTLSLFFLLVLEWARALHGAPVLPETLIPTQDNFDLERVSFIVLFIANANFFNW